MNTRRLCLSLVLVAGISGSIRAGDWPQWMGPNRDNVIIGDNWPDKLPDKINIKWRVKTGAGYASPTVAGGKVFVFDHVTKPGAAKPKSPFDRITVTGSERILCLDEATGKQLWLQEYDCDYSISYNSGPRGAPCVDGESLYTLGAEGDLQCRSIADGKLIWQKHLGGKETPIWGFASSPLVAGDKVIVFTADKDGFVQAFNKTSGEPTWKSVKSSAPGYSSPILIDAGGAKQLICWGPDNLSSLDPETGKIHWSEPFVCKQGMSIATPRVSGDLLLVSCFYNGSMMMKLDKEKPAATKLWKIGGANERKTEALHAVMCTPVIHGDHIYGDCSYGQLRCLKTQTGERVWETFDATTGDAGAVRWGNVFINTVGDREFLFNEHGDLIIAKFSPDGYKQISKAHLIDANNMDAGRPTVWCQPAYANGCVFVKSDKEIVCVELTK